MIPCTVDAALAEHGGDIDVPTEALVKKAVPNGIALFEIRLHDGGAEREPRHPTTRLDAYRPLPGVREPVAQGIPRL